MEEKKYKEGKKVLKLRQIIKKHEPRKTFKFINNNFFFWKDLYQQYSSNKNLCKFIDYTNDLIPSHLKDELIKCITNIIQLEIDKYNKYISEIKITIQENKLFPDHIKNEIITNSCTPFENKINDLLQYLSKDDRKDETKFSIDDLKEIVYNNIKSLFIKTGNDILYNISYINFIWNKYEPELNEIINKSFSDKWHDIYIRMYTDFVLNTNISSDDIVNNFHEITETIYDTIKNKSINKIDLNYIKRLFFSSIEDKDEKELEEAWNRVKDNFNELKSLEPLDSNIFQFSTIYHQFARILNEDLIDSYQKFSYIWEELKTTHKRLSTLKPKSSNDKLCEFISSKNIDKYLQRSIIECIERTLAMNTQKLSLSCRIKIVQELETVIPKIEINIYKKEDDVKPLYFKIYDVIIPRERKDSKLITVIDKLTNFLNDTYEDMYPNYKLYPHFKIMIDKILLISTLTYLKPFINEIEFFISERPGLNHIKPDITYLNSIIHEYIYYKGRWEFPIKTNNVEDYVKYLIDNLNLYMDVINLELPDQEIFNGNFLYHSQYEDQIRSQLNTLLGLFIQSDKHILNEGEINKMIKYIKNHLVEGSIEIDSDSYKDFDYSFDWVLNELKPKYPELFIQKKVDWNEINSLYKHLLLYIKDKFLILTIDSYFKSNFINILRKIQNESRFI